MLMEVLVQPPSRSQSSTAARTNIAATEARLLQAITKVINVHRSSIGNMRRVLLQLQLAQRLAGQHCLDMGQALKHSARMNVEYRWETIMQSLWRPPSGAHQRGNTA